tara:strand:- start:761 stop:1159 length:399 start_codon:yes stop_codon:yes gene_type:complete
MSQDKNGTNLRLCIHPDDVPQELHQHWVGSRYMVAMVKLTDEDEPELSEDQIRKQRLFKSAIMVCKEKSFWSYLDENSHFGLETSINSEEGCAKQLRDRLGISSRSELKTNNDALNRFENMLMDYRDYKELP